jgi:exopolysaccharide biosynthesis polyprenyl glycosylphosphotransferase
MARRKYTVKQTCLGKMGSCEESTASAPHARSAFMAIWGRRGLLLSVLDAALIFAAFVSAYFARFYGELFMEMLPPPVSVMPPFNRYLEIAFVVTGAWFFLLWRDKAYENRLHFSRALVDQIQSVIVTGFYSMVFVMVISFLFRYFLLSRVVYAVGFVLAGTLLSLVRVCFSVIDRTLHGKGVVLKRVVMLGSERNTQSLLENFDRLTYCSRVIGRLTWTSERPSKENGVAELRVLGSGRDVEEVYEKHPFDQIMVTDYGDADGIGRSAQSEILMQIVNFCESRNIPVYMVPSFLEIAVSPLDIGSISGIPLFMLQDSSLQPFHAVSKRVLDILISIVVLFGGLPLWFAIAALIKVTSRGTIFYMQERVGLHGKTFRMYKFRSMVQGADKQLGKMVDLDSLREPVFNIRNDPRLTAVGRILRRTSLDEIPQFINVLLGSMSIVGPRPERVELVCRYNAFQRRRLKAKPGITGYQQVMSRGDPSLAKRVEYDLYYLKHQNILLDLIIIFRTIIVVIRGDGLK